MVRGETWVALFSGGKDSTWALHEAYRNDVSVEYLLTARPIGDSYLFHTPATDLTALMAESIGLPHESFAVEPPDGASVADATSRGDQELTTLAEAVERLDERILEGIDGIVSGAVASTFQRGRIDRLCDRYDLEHFCPLWDCNADETLIAMVEAGFDIRMIAVSAGGLGREWLGRRIDADTVDALRRVRERHGIHLLGEGGEYETAVVAGPHMARRLRFEARPRWDGIRGRLEIQNAWLESGGGVDV